MTLFPPTNDENLSGRLPVCSVQHSPYHNINRLEYANFVQKFELQMGYQD